MAASSIIWVAPDFLGWFGYLSSFKRDNDQVVREHHAIWQHANELFAYQKEPRFITSCLIQLNRAVDFRDSTLDESYHFRRIPGLGRMNRHEIMELLGIIKPIMRKKLDNIRNRLTHIQGAKVPTSEECAELIEFVWYFLKSTDRFAARPIRTATFDYDGDDGDFGVDVKIGDDAWTLEINGRFPKAQVSRTSVSGWLQIEACSGRYSEFEKEFAFGSARLVRSEQFVQYFAKTIFELY